MGESGEFGLELPVGTRVMTPEGEGVVVGKLFRTIRDGDTHPEYIVSPDLFPLSIGDRGYRIVLVYSFRPDLVSVLEVVDEE